MADSAAARAPRARGGSRTPRHDLAATARIYRLDEPAMTRDDVMAARGWDRRHRRYRRVAPEPSP